LLFAVVDLGTAGEGHHLGLLTWSETSDKGIINID